MTERMVTLVQLSAAIDDAGTETRHGWSDHPDFQADGSASAPLAAWEGRVRCAGNYERHAFQAGGTTGRGGFQAGGIRIDNTDGALDALLTSQDAAGHELVIRRGPEAGRRVTDYPIHFRGTAEAVEAEGNELVITPSSRLADILAGDIQSVTYKGDNVGNVGSEGTADELGGKPKVTLLGGVSNVTPAWVNRERLVLHLAQKLYGGAVTVEGLWDGGAPWTPGLSRASLDELMDTATVPGAGKFDWWDGDAGTYVKLGSPANGTVTGSVAQGDPADRSIARIVRSVLIAKGMPWSDIEGVDALDALCGDEVGTWIGTETRTTGDALAELLDGAGAWLIGTRLDRARLGLLTAPAGRPVFTFEEWMIQGDLSVARPADGDGQPVRSLTYTYDRNFTVMRDADLFGAGKDRAGWLGQESRSVVVETPDLTKRFRKAGTMTVDSRFRTAAVAGRHAARLADLRRRNWRIVTFHVDPLFAARVDLMDTAALVHRRYGLAAGRLFTVLGIADDFGDRDRAALSTVYGWIEL